MATIRDVARACGVSPMTVSYVLNNKAGQVSERTRLRVMKAIRELDYRPTALERSPEARANMTIGVLAGIPGNSLMSASAAGYHTRIFQNILVAAEADLHNVLVFPNSLLHQDTSRAIRVYCDGRCDGLITVAPSLNDPLIAALKERGFPFVAISNLSDDPTVTCVDIDNRKEAAHAVAYLYTQGHRRIEMLRGPDFVPSARQRWEGFYQAMIEFGLHVTPIPEWDGSFWHDDVYWQALEIARRPANLRPTALFCWNDGWALRALQAMHDAGVKVPDEMSLVGLDDDFGSDTSSPPLTTFRQPYEAISRNAVRLMLEYAKDTSLPPKSLLLPAELIVRGSVAPPKEA